MVRVHAWSVRDLGLNTILPIFLVYQIWQFKILKNQLDFCHLVKLLILIKCQKKTMCNSTISLQRGRITILSFISIASTKQSYCIFYENWEISISIGFCGFCLFDFPTCIVNIPQYVLRATRWTRPLPNRPVFPLVRTLWIPTMMTFACNAVSGWLLMTTEPAVVSTHFKYNFI